MRRTIDREQVVDYTSNPDQDGTNTKVEFAGDRLQEWLDGHGSRPQADGKPSGVRWSMSRIISQLAS